MAGFLDEDEDLEVSDDDVLNEDDANSASTSFCSTMDRIGEELRLEMEEHFDYITKNLDDRLDILEVKEKDMGSMERRFEELGIACTEKEKELSSMKT
ncbi:hypothetical protein CRG98_043932 [Punica granatum]|uniref:Uncharacterized protein n=1 Tax=Punica granatum TaxID=22663 RepID=A0A2I0HVD6_PUNGR|nr:hypothetical protein CRG98_043932 [Punica granatum]